MDAEIWSQADIRNGGRLFAAVLALILLKDLGGLLLPLFGLPGPDRWDAALLLLVKLALLFLMDRGLQMARLGLGVIYLAGAGLLGLGLLREAGAAQEIAGQLALADAGLGLLLGGLLITAAPLRAYCWHRAPARLTIPIPHDDAPAASRRRATALGATLRAGLRRLVGGLLVLTLLGAAAYVYGLPELLRARLTGRDWHLPTLAGPGALAGHPEIGYNDLLTF